MRIPAGGKDAPPKEWKALFQMEMDALTGALRGARAGDWEHGMDALTCAPCCAWAGGARVPLARQGLAAALAASAAGTTPDSPPLALAAGRSAGESEAAAASSPSGPSRPRNLPQRGQRLVIPTGTSFSGSPDVLTPRMVLAPPPAQHPAAPTLHLGGHSPVMLAPMHQMPQVR